MTNRATPLHQIPLTQLKGVGPKMAEKLAILGINNIQDLLFHLPLRYQDRSRITPIGSLQPNADAVIEGEIKAADVVFGRRRSLVCRLQDNTGTITLRFFHFSAAQKQNLSAGNRLRCFGEARRGSSGLEIYHPEYQTIEQPLDEGSALTNTALEQSLTPVYPSTDGLSQQSWRKLSQQALQLLGPHTLIDYLEPAADTQPADDNFGFDPQTTLDQVLRYLHQPPTHASLALLREGKHPFQQRLAFEELLAHNLSLLRLRSKHNAQPAPAFTAHAPNCELFLDQLGFKLTSAQQRVSKEIITDLQRSQPMLRLVQGDVGSGKTVVAALAALKAVANGYQVAIMAPTEILAEQHFNNFCQWLQPLNVSIGWLSGKVKGKQRQQQLVEIADPRAEHRADIIIGTHALFQEEVQFYKLGLAIIDEQHRFGVHQRLALKEKANPRFGHPHQLIMTATPIPRTLAMSAYADMDTSIIDELPPGRTPINTVVIDNSRRQHIIDRVRKACGEGRQAYWVCTLIEESETLEAQAAQDSCELLQQTLPELKVGLIHGRMKAADKALIMQQFKNHQLDLLVATTVIEVGVDVANASLMIIENAERLGLAQLHQLRGRVGRGNTASHCVLMYQAPISQLGKQRLQTMRANSDGFVIAEKDLQLRGPGELLGTRQTGLLQLRIAKLERDGHLLEEVKITAHHLILHKPEIVTALIKRWLANSEQFAQV
jgi:ATP-dependent DNA helicase RecG